MSYLLGLVLSLFEDSSVLIDVNYLRNAFHFSAVYRGVNYIGSRAK